jgi:flavin reductase (DIM6/NTAB) family NADH-FMN oxidoreductase RutF
MSAAVTTHVVIEPSVLYFGTPVCLISTQNPDSTPNLAPMSSTWYLSDSAVLGIASGGQTILNLRRTGECVINLPSIAQRDAVEQLAPLTGRNPVPEYKRARSRYEPRKFEVAGLTPVASELVVPPRAAECPVQLEAKVQAIHDATGEQGFAMVEARVVRVHVEQKLVIPGTHYVDTDAWQPLMYVFRHYFSLGDDLGRNFRAEQ